MTDTETGKKEALDKYYKRIVEFRDMGFMKDIGLKSLEIGEGYAKSEVVIEPRHINPIGSVHGGVLYTIADAVGGTAAVSRGKMVTTLSGSMNYLRPAINCKKVIGESREIKVGKNVCVYEVMLRDETGKELALATMTYYYMGAFEI